MSGHNYVDIDECEDGTDSCNENAVCNNIDGNYTCSCLPGYSGNGTSCDGMYTGLRYSIVAQSGHPLPLIFNFYQISLPLSFQFPFDTHMCR